MEPPAPDGLPHRLGGPGTDRGREVDEILSPAMLRPSWTKRIAQEIEALLGERAPSVGIFTVHDVCLVGMQFQVALRQPCRDARMKPARLRFTLAMRAASIGIALEGNRRLFPLHPGIERVMQEEIRKDGTDTTPLRGKRSQGVKFISH